MELKSIHLKTMEGVEGGATIWGYREAKLLREIQQVDTELVKILNLSEVEEITGEHFDGAKQLPYFGAVLTDKGREFLKGRLKRD